MTSTTPVRKLTIDEVISLCSLLEMSEFPGVDDSIIESLSPEEVDERIASGGRSLLARGLLAVDESDDIVTVEAGLAELLARLAGPLVSVYALRVADEVAVARYWHVGPTDVLEQDEVLGVLGFDLHAIDHARVRFRAFLGLDGRPEPRGAAFTISEDQLFSLPSAAALSADIPAEFVTALATSGGVTFVEAAMVDGGHVEHDRRIAWVDGGDGGCWLVDPLDGDASIGELTLTVSPAGTAEIVDRIAHMAPLLV